ncbi:hypothetical protein D9613_009678 [Agrocybe pediades]|uniref:Uncharacterized protein n=1 Tax=Agrocybe pediades TaxID=84607 RepID=A0A8H4QWL7_9AGAR|nr:hypothetical protein D9613_009678 [Agrocybe pediades]
MFANTQRKSSITLKVPGAPKPKTIGLPFHDVNDQAYLTISLQISWDPLPPRLFAGLGPPSMDSVSQSSSTSDSGSVSGGEDLDEATTLLARLRMTRKRHSRVHSQPASPRSPR